MTQFYISKYKSPLMIKGDWKDTTHHNAISKQDLSNTAPSLVIMGCGHYKVCAFLLNLQKFIQLPFSVQSQFNPRHMLIHGR